MEELKILSTDELGRIHGGVTALREMGRSAGRYLLGFWDGLTGG